MPEHNHPLNLLQLFILTSLIVGLIYAIFRFWRFYYKPFESVHDSTFPDSKMLDIGDCKVRFIQRGSRLNPPLLLVHGLFASIYCWRNVINELAKNYYVIAIDLPGFGMSDKIPSLHYDLDHQTERIYKFTQILNLENFYLIGHSMGGGLSAWLTKKHPGLVRKLILVAPAINKTYVKFNPSHLLWGSKFLHKRIVTPMLVRIVYKRVCKKLPNQNLDTIIAEYYKPFHEGTQASVAALKNLEVLRDKRLAKALTNLPTPTHIIYSVKDPVIDTRAIEKYLSENPSVTHTRLKECGHLIAEEEPDLLISTAKNIFS